MEQNLPNPPKKFRRIPLYLGRIALFLAFVPLAMTILCFVTGNAFNSLIDVYYWFITPFQVCKCSALISLAFAFATSASARSVYYTDKDSYRNEYYTAIRLSMRAAALVIFEIVIYIYIITFQT